MNGSKLNKCQSLKLIEDEACPKSSKSIKFKEKNEVFKYKSEKKMRSHRKIKKNLQELYDEDDDCCQLIWSWLILSLS